jgi:hypothetical protein
MNEDALRRVQESAGVGADIVETLANLPGADLTTLLLEVMRRRTAHMSPADVMRRYRDDRFVTPSPIPLEDIRRAEELAFAALPNSFETLALSPVAPLATHSLAGVAQANVVSTIRSTEVAADPTNALALEAAVRRKAHPADPARVRLAASQRVVRAQRFEGEDSFAHFQLFGIVTAGRDSGSLGFEREAVTEHIRVAVDALVGAALTGIRVELTDLRGDALGPVAESVRAAMPDRVHVIDRPDRSSGRAYYDAFCFKVFIEGDRSLEIGDGGLVDWTQHLVPSRKERLCISGLGLDRFALALAD